MSSRTKQLLRKGAIAGVAFITGIVGTVLAASVYDATIQSRANKILDAVKSNASQMDKSQVPAYYALVIMNIRSLIQVLDQVENGLLTNSDAALIEGLITPVSPTPGGTTTTGATTNPVTQCNGTEPTGNGVLKKVSGFGGVQNTTWVYNPNGYDTNTACTWKCDTGYTQSGNTCVKQATTSSCNPNDGYCNPSGSTTSTNTSTNTNNSNTNTNNTTTTTNNTTNSNTSVENPNGPAGSFETQEQFNKRYSCTGTVPTNGQKIGPINYVGYQDIPGVKNTVWRSLYSLSDADRASEKWKSCTWYCDMTYSWNGSRCISQGDIRFSSTQYTLGQNLGGKVTTDDAVDSYYMCMDTPTNPTNCANGANFTQLSKNPDWIHGVEEVTLSQFGPNYKVKLHTFTLRSDFRIENYPTGKYTGYLAVAENGVVKDPYRTANRHSFTVVPASTSGGSDTSGAPRLYFNVSGKTLNGEIYTSNPDNTWACTDPPGKTNCNDRANWSKMPTSGWTKSNFGYVLSGFSTEGYPSGPYTGYVAIGRDGAIGTNGSASFNLP